VTINKLLVANRGEIASRIFRTARRMDIATVAVYSDPDAHLPYAREADEAVHLPGAAPARTYLRGEALIDAARLRLPVRKHRLRPRVRRGRPHLRRAVT
jgi:propionyl-CoA carboxylase alpha chain